MPSVQPPVWVLVIVAGADLGRQVRLGATPISIGRGWDDDFVLRDIFVTHRQLVIEWDEQSADILLCKLVTRSRPSTTSR